MFKRTISDPDPTPRGCPHSAATLIQHDLCARLTPLDQYGLADFGSALADGLRTLARRALHAVGARTGD